MSESNSKTESAWVLAVTYPLCYVYLLFLGTVFLTFAVFVGCDYYQYLENVERRSQEELMRRWQQDMWYPAQLRNFDRESYLGRVAAGLEQVTFTSLLMDSTNGATTCCVCLEPLS